MLLRFAATCLITACLLVLLAIPVVADVETAERFEAADSPGVTALREGDTLYLRVDEGVEGPITIPRLAAPLRSMRWMSRDAGEGLRLNPGQETWQISWARRAGGELTLELVFGEPPLLPSEAEPLHASADGSVYLPAHRADFGGERIRYEPQPNKNTVGYWTGANDMAGWTFNIDRPGRYSVAILQGCGRNQGGSTGVIWVGTVGEREPSNQLTFEVVETGHFQNFRWVHVGEVELPSRDPYGLTIRPLEIANAALMDVRAVHLIRLPD